MKPFFKSLLHMVFCMIGLHQWEADLWYIGKELMAKSWICPHCGAWKRME